MATADSRPNNGPADGGAPGSPPRPTADGGYTEPTFAPPPPSRRRRSGSARRHQGMSYSESFKFDGLAGFSGISTSSGSPTARRFEAAKGGAATGPGLTGSGWTGPSSATARMETGLSRASLQEDLRALVRVACTISSFREWFLVATPTHPYLQAKFLI